MTEAWLLINEPAIRRASGNPNGTKPLNLPDLTALEQIQDPKQILFDVLRKASGLRGRRLKTFNMSECRIRVTELINDFSSLRELTAFQRLEEDIEKLKQSGWQSGFGDQIR